MPVYWSAIVKNVLMLITVLKLINLINVIIVILVIRGVYHIKIGDFLYKYGKADMTKIVKKTGLPKRLHTQIEDFKKLFPNYANQISNIR